MRGQDLTNKSLFYCVDLDARLPAQHPLREMPENVNEASAKLNGSLRARYKDCSGRRTCGSVPGPATRKTVPQAFDTQPLCRLPPNSREPRPTVPARG